MRSNVSRENIWQVQACVFHAQMAIFVLEAPTLSCLSARQVLTRTLSSQHALSAQRAISVSTLPTYHTLVRLEVTHLRDRRTALLAQVSRHRALCAQTMVFCMCASLEICVSRVRISVESVRQPNNVHHLPSKK